MKYSHLLNQRRTNRGYGLVLDLNSKEIAGACIRRCDYAGAKGL